MPQPVMVHVRPYPFSATLHDPGLQIDLPDGADALGLLIVGPAGRARHVFAVFGPRGGVSLTSGFATDPTRLGPAPPGMPPASVQFLSPPLPAEALRPLPLPGAEVLARLATAPTFFALVALADTHGGSAPWVLPALGGDSDTVATVLCRVADGWLAVPAFRTDPAAGWEQLDHAAAVVLPDTPAVAQALALWDHAANALRTALLPLLDRAAAPAS